MDTMIAILGAFFAGGVFGWWFSRYINKPQPPAEDKNAERSRREYINFLTYDGSEQEEIR